MYKEMGAYQEAISAYEQALDYGSNTLADEALACKILYNLGFALEVRGDPDQALDHLQ